jgi:5-methyltetrahydropteroyltriglutamate--homocysteine methyltransferase
MTTPAAFPVAAYQHGIYPRSEAVVQATRDLERGRTTPDRVVDAFRADRESYLDLQREAGLDFVSDGLLRWQDLFRPLVEGSAGMEARVLVRWFDNNAFFRAPQVQGAPTLGDLPAWVLEDGIPGPGVATLPSPYLFSRASLFRGDRDDLMVGLAGDVLAPAVAKLVAAGHRLVHLEEPWLPYAGIDQDSWPALEAAVGAVREAADDAVLVLHTYFGDTAPHAERLRRLPVDAIGVDFGETDLDSLPAPWGTGLVAGCLDGRTSLVEGVDAVVAFVRRVVDRLQPSSLFVTSGSDLELLGPEVAPAKVRLLGEVAARLRSERT